MNFFQKELEKIKEYFKNNSVIMTFLSYFSPIYAVINAAYGLIRDKPFFLWIAVFVFILFVLCIYINKKYIKITNLFLDKDTYLINTIINIIEVKELKQKNNINHVKVKELKCFYTIGSTSSDSPQQSKLDVRWQISCKSLDRELFSYHILYAKNRLIKYSTPKVTIRDINKEYATSITSKYNDLLNHYEIVIKNEEIPRDTDFNVNVELNNYYTFLWNCCEVLIINTSLWGDIVEKTTINLTFDEEKISNSVISIYIVSQSNFQRRFLKSGVCSKNDFGKYEYQFEYNKKTSNAFFLIKIPKKIN